MHFVRSKFGVSAISSVYFQRFEGDGVTVFKLNFRTDALLGHCSRKFIFCVLGVE